MEMFAAAAPWLFGLSIPYVIWLDRYMMEPRDGAFAFGQLIIGAAGKPDQEEVRNHLRSWLVKGFFLDRKSTRLNSVTNAHLVCRLLLEKKKNKIQKH